MPRWIRGIPILGVFLRYLNLYVGRGELKYLLKFAPPHLWLDRFVVPVCTNLTLVGLYWLYIVMTDTQVTVDGAGLVTSVFPSLLGFGIGVFALIFVLPDDLMGSLDARKAKSGMGSSMMISDMAYPLIYLALAMALSAGMEALIDPSVAVFLHLFLFLYGLTLVCDLIGVIAAAALASRVRKAKSKEISSRKTLLSKLRRSLGDRG